MGYYEGNISDLSTGCNNGGMWGGDGIWAILLLALLGGGYGFGRGGFGGGTGYGAGSEFVGYELGKTATQADVASGFNNSAVLSNLNDQKLALANGFAGVQQTLCQGFSGVNQTVLSGFAGVDNAICTLGYQNQQGFNALGQQLASCCCDLKQMNLENRYLNERQTCEIVNAINMGNQRLVDIYNNDKIDTLNRKLAVAEGQISQYAQTNAIVSALKQPCPVPAYTVPNPNCCYNACGGQTL
jgi:flagellar biosynthesis/type III secretory pathway chaperone